MNKPIDFMDLKEIKFAPKSYIVHPILEHGSLSMLHSWRGTGKTLFALGMAQAVATNSPFLKWNTSMSSVFYFDCEMGMEDLSQRFQMMDRAAKYKIRRGGIELFTFEHMGGYTWNLTDPKVQDVMDKLLANKDYLIIDNLSAACKPIGREDFKAAYGRLRDWLLRLKNRKIGVLIVHHSGKQGLQRGISDIEDPLDIVMHLRRPEDWKITDGSIFEFHFEKTRNLNPSDPKILEPIQIEVRSFNEGKDIEWHYRPCCEIEEENKMAKIKAVKEFKDDRYF